jgi:hypothetical protein
VSDIHRFLGPVQWKTEKASEWTIATIISDDVLILPHRANPVGWNFREPQDGDRSCLGAYPAVSCFVWFAFDGGAKIRDEKVYEYSELGSEMPARRP